MDRSIYDADLDFFYNEAASFLGAKGTLSSTVSALERGNASNGVFDDPLPEKLDARPWAVKTEREVRTRLAKLSDDERRLLQVHYTFSVGPGDAKAIKSRDLEALNRIKARFGDYSATVVFLAHKQQVDLFGAKNGSQIADLAELAERKLKAAHKAWRATKPKERNAKRDFDLPSLPDVA